MRHTYAVSLTIFAALSAVLGAAQSKPAVQPTNAPTSAAAQQEQSTNYQPAVATPAVSDNVPRVFMQSSSHGSNWNSRRDQSMELTKDFQKQCPEARVTTVPEKADYIITLNHIEHGWARDNQIEISNKSGDVLETREKGSIANNVKNACAMITEDWRKTSSLVK
ncbi:MAG TPA: hypothetical protein VF753_14925 [Terriglobales bacterium]